MRLILFWAAGLLLVGAAPPTAVLFRTHLLDATVLAILRRLLADVRSEHHVAVIYDSDVLRLSSGGRTLDATYGSGGRRSLATVRSAKTGSTKAAEWTACE